MPFDALSTVNPDAVSPRPSESRNRAESSTIRTFRTVPLVACDAVFAPPIPDKRRMHPVPFDNLSWVTVRGLAAGYEAAANIAAGDAVPVKACNLKRMTNY
jgi:hypothetical protein